MKTADLTKEEWREYIIGSKTYRIDNPKTFYMREGGTTHRILDSAGIVHCVPIASAIIRWKPKNVNDPVQF